jgi:type II secretory pathway pseudopilin PulG
MKHGTENRSGFTLVEMAVAIISATILIGIVYGTWNHITVSTELRKRKTLLHSECARITRLVTGTIQKSEAVLRYDRNAVWLLNGQTSDTTVFSLDGDVLMRNGKPVNFLLPGVSVAEFSFENNNSDQSGQPYLLRFRCMLLSRQNDTATAEATVMGRRPQGDGTQSGNDFMW